MYELKGVTAHTANVYHFHYAHGGWAVWIIDDATGTLSLVSDWGEYAHRWSSNPKHLGAATLTDAIRQFNPHYIADKLHYGRERDRFNAGLSIREIKRRICEARRNGDIDRAKARDLFDDVDNWYPQTEDDFHRDMDSDLAAFLEHPHEYACREQTPRFLTIQDKLIPDLLAHLRLDDPPDRP